MIDIRLMLLPDDKEKTLKKLAEAFEFVSVSESYANRGNSKLVRVYIKAQLKPANSFYEEYMFAICENEIVAPVVGSNSPSYIYKKGEEARKCGANVIYKTRSNTEWKQLNENELLLRVLSEKAKKERV